MLCDLKTRCDRYGYCALDTVELQWLEHFWNHENTFETGEFELMGVNHSGRSGNIIGIFSIFLKMKVFCEFLLESPHRGDSNEYTQYTFFNIKKKNQPKLSQICSCGIFPKDSKPSLTQPW